MKFFRKIIFWTHLISGVTASLVIAVMAFTGVVLAFETTIVAWAERDLTRVTPPSEKAPRLAVKELMRRVGEATPGAKVSGIVVKNDPMATVDFTQGRENAWHVDPYRGEVRLDGERRVRRFMQTMLNWHRWLGRGGDSRSYGRAVTGVCNAVFLVLALSGLYLWFPRTWNWRTHRPAVWFSRGLQGRARDWNWHNVFGFWSAPVLIVLTATGVVMSYRWANNLVYQLAGTEPPPAPGGVNPDGRSGANSLPTGENASDYDVLIAVAAQASPDWQEITLRGGPLSIVATIRTNNTSPVFATRSITMNAATGAITREEYYSDQSAGRRARMWVRYLHTGEALGWVGQFAAGVASLGGVLLVYTGLAMAWRRFRARRRRG